MKPDPMVGPLEVQDPCKPDPGAILLRGDGLPARMVLGARQSSASQTRARVAFIGATPDGDPVVLAQFRLEMN